MQSLPLFQTSLPISLPSPGYTDDRQNQALLVCHLPYVKLHISIYTYKAAFCVNVCMCVLDNFSEGDQNYGHAAPQNSSSYIQQDHPCKQKGLRSWWLLKKCNPAKYPKTLQLSLLFFCPLCYVHMPQVIILPCYFNFLSQYDIYPNVPLRTNKSHFTFFEVIFHLCTSMYFSLILLSYN